jgi:formamidopyrimidine-DNA glycosylase
VFRDVRKFGRLHVTEGRPAERLDRLGPDAWLGDWDPAYLGALLRGRSAPLKAFLLDQRHLAGIGNIYADEILFGARLSPLRPSGDLRPAEIVRLAGEIRERLEEGVRLRGCSISDFVDTEGSPGSFQDSLRAYGRHGEPCVECGRPLARTVVGGRGTAFCPHCQR